ncbi:MAG TPA: hypothetical protein VHU21_10830 [Paraburkholderia sp.]|nr:hypothetical protein [Paraburkholderia sp.]
MLEANRFVMHVTRAGKFAATARGKAESRGENNGQRRYPQNVLKDLLIRPGDRSQVPDRAMDSVTDAFAHAARTEGLVAQESDLND